MSDNDIRRELARGTLVAVRPGVYAAADSRNGITGEQLHLQAVRAASLTTAGVVSHQSAAVLHGFRLWNPDLRLVHMTIDRASGGRITTRRHVHASPLRPEDVVDVDGVVVTSPARTVADLLRALPFEAAVCVGDSALRTGVVTPDEITESLASLPQRGVSTALTTAAFLDGRSETVGESRSRVMLRTFGFPAPQLQVRLYSAGGRFIARTDMLFEDEGVVAEFDGFVKYSSYVPAGSTPSQVAFDEKRREDDLRSHGWVVVRWVWADLATPHALVARIRRAFAIAESMPTPRTLPLS